MAFKTSICGHYFLDPKLHIMKKHVLLKLKLCPFLISIYKPSIIIHYWCLSFFRVSKP